LYSTYKLTPILIAYPTCPSGGILPSPGIEFVVNLI